MPCLEIRTYILGNGGKNQSIFLTFLEMKTWIMEREMRSNKRLSKRLLGESQGDMIRTPLVLGAEVSQSIRRIVFNNTQSCVNGSQCVECM